jgi:predicted Rossmann fold nucleotide-binding protein DprA/Smf involved in DNA uptake
MNTPEKTSARGETLKRLRAAHAESVERAQSLLKEQKRIQQQIMTALQDGPKSVPDVAKATGLAEPQVLWFLAAMKKYNLVVENGMDDDYPLYQKAEEA